MHKRVQSYASFSKQQILPQRFLKIISIYCVFSPSTCSKRPLASWCRSQNEPLHAISINFANALKQRLCRGLFWVSNNRNGDLPRWSRHSAARCYVIAGACRGTPPHSSFVFLSLFELMFKRVDCHIDGFFKRVSHFRGKNLARLRNHEFDSCLFVHCRFRLYHF